MTRAAFATADSRLDRDAAKARERHDAALLAESARCVVIAFQGSGSADQKRDRLKALITAGCDAYEALLGPDDAHPFLAGLGKATGFRLTAMNQSARTNGERLFKPSSSEGSAA